MLRLAGGFFVEQQRNKVFYKLGAVIFIVLGFLWEPLMNASRTNTPGRVAGSGNRARPVTTLEEVNWDEISGDIGKYMTQNYGMTSFASVYGGLQGHNGIDIKALYGSRVLSQSDGVVVLTGDTDRFCKRRSYGKFVAVENSENNYTLLYAHLRQIAVGERERVRRGDIIGYVGETGFATGPHLHFSVFKTDEMRITENGSCGPKPQGGEINPLDYLK